MIRSRYSKRASAATILALAMTSVVVACGDDPFQITWLATPDTVLLYSLARPELGLPTAFDLYDRAQFVVEAPGSTDKWDIAIDTREGELVMVPPGGLGITSDARITMIPGVGYDDVTEAPADSTLYSGTEPWPLALGNVYVVRTREQSTSFGFCSVYAKLQPVALDGDIQSATFVFDNNPRCDDRSLMPDQEREP